MLSNYFKIAFRNLVKNRMFSILNIFGLALSMSVCLFILLLFKDAYQYDRFHPEGKRVYRVNTEALRKGGDQEPYASSPFPLGTAMLEGFSQVEEMTHINRSLNGEGTVNGLALPIRGYFADPSFFRVFGFSMLEGIQQSALNEPFSIVLSQSTADRFFPRESAIGKVIEIGSYGAFKVTGVLAPPPGKTHLEFDALAAMATVPVLEKSAILGQVSDNWSDYYSSHTYVRLRENASTKQVENALAALAKDAYAKLTLESRDAGYRFYLQPLHKITPGPLLSNSMGRAIPAIMLWFLAAMGLVIILSACFNYTNLTLARSLTRAREIGVRKVMGATRGQVFKQLVSEGVLTAVFSLGLAWVLLKLIQPGFNRLSFAAFMDVSVKEDGKSFLWFFAFALLTGLLAGGLPALVMSRINPAGVLRKLESLRLLGRIGLRKVLLVVQFTVTLVFIIMVSVISGQIKHAMRMDYGFDAAHLINVQLQGQAIEKVIPALSAVPGVERISAMDIPMGTYMDMGTDIKTGIGEDPNGVRAYSVDHHFVENFGLTLIAGQNFPSTHPDSTQETFVLVNEQFLKRYKLGTPTEAVGKQLFYNDTTSVQIRGVLKDFLFKPADYALEPLLIRNRPADWRMLSLKINSPDPAATQAALQIAWAKVVPNRPLEAEFYETTLRDNYASLRDMLSILSVFTFLGIVIAMLGLLGMATYTVETRTKEVGLRKVLGANVLDLMLLLSRNFLILQGISIVLAVPFAWFFGTLFLSSFAQRISMNAGLVLPGILLLLGVALLTIGTQTYRAALKDPVKTLKSE